MLFLSCSFNSSASPSSYRSNYRTQLQKIFIFIDLLWVKGLVEPSKQTLKNIHFTIFYWHMCIAILNCRDWVVVVTRRAHNCVTVFLAVIGMKCYCDCKRRFGSLQVTLIKNLWISMGDIDQSKKEVLTWRFSSQNTIRSLGWENSHWEIFKIFLFQILQIFRFVQIFRFFQFSQFFFFWFFQIFQYFDFSIVFDFFDFSKNFLIFAIFQFFQILIFLIFQIFYCFLKIIWFFRFFKFFYFFRFL